MFRTIKFAQAGGPEVLEFIDMEAPDPGPHEVRIKVQAIGINRAESMWRNDKYVESPIFLAGLGYEAAGIVDAVGKDIAGFAVGDAVSTIPAYSLNKYSTYGEVILAPDHAVVKHPETLSFVEAASVWMMFLTAYGALVFDAQVKAGDFVIITAASSSVGLAAIQIANYAGATPIALTRTSEKKRRLHEAGAEHVVATQEQDMVAEVMRITDGNGARVVFDPVGGPDFAKLIAALAFHGVAYIYGALSEDGTSLPVLEMIRKMPVVKVASEIAPAAWFLRVTTATIPVLFRVSVMRCSVCGSAAVRERPERTAQGYRRFRCRCGKQFNERSTGLLNRTQYPSDVIALVVLWRLRYKLSLRDLAEMFLIRGFVFSYEAVRDWEAKLTLALADELRRRRRGKVGPSWYVDETYIRVHGRWKYLYRTIDRDGALVDVMLSEHRDIAAAKAFFRSAKAVAGITPDRVTTDGHDAYPRAIRTELGKRVRHRTNQYLNNRLEQDHRAIKGRCRPMLGFKSTASAGRYCRGHDELRDFLRCRLRMCQHVPAATRRLRHMRRTAIALGILEAA